MVSKVEMEKSRCLSGVGGAEVLTAMVAGAVGAGTLYPTLARAALLNFLSANANVSANAQVGARDWSRPAQSERAGRLRARMRGRRLSDGTVGRRDAR